MRYEPGELLRSSLSDTRDITDCFCFFTFYILSLQGRCHTVFTAMFPYCGNGFFGDVTGFLVQVPTANLPHQHIHNPE